jgi:hypothetical protein
MTTYAIQVIECDQPDWLVDLRTAVDEELESVDPTATITVTVETAAPADPDVVSVAAYLGSEAAAADPGVAGATAAALAAGRVVIPVVSDLARFSREVPSALAPINGFPWTWGPQKLARVLLAELGIEERQRRAFISHKRDDGLGAAEQLHDQLAHIGFRPFIDRFAIPLGRDVQAEIADALEDHAFVLFLETPLAHTSDWVFYEVDHALLHTLGLLIVTWPGDVTPMRGSNGLPRLKLDDGDLTRDPHGYDVLTAGGLQRVLAAAEAAHASGLVRRRRKLVESITDAAAAAGGTSTPLPGWRVAVEQAGATTLFGITPRLPTASDLQLLDGARTFDHHAVVLVHSERPLRDELTTHLTWVCGNRELELTPQSEVGGRWS